jgi:hypothetical protein
MEQNTKLNDRNDMLFRFCKRHDIHTTNINRLEHILQKAHQLEHSEKKFVSETRTLPNSSFLSRHYSCETKFLFVNSNLLQEINKPEEEKIIPKEVTKKGKKQNLKKGIPRERNICSQGHLENPTRIIYISGGGTAKPRESNQMNLKAERKPNFNNSEPPNSSTAPELKKKKMALKKYNSSELKLMESKISQSSDQHWLNIEKESEKQQAVSVELVNKTLDSLSKICKDERKLNLYKKSLEKALYIPVGSQDSSLIHQLKESLLENSTCEQFLESISNNSLNSSVSLNEDSQETVLVEQSPTKLDTKVQEAFQNNLNVSSAKTFLEPEILPRTAESFLNLANKMVNQLVISAFPNFNTLISKDKKGKVAQKSVV